MTDVQDSLKQRGSEADLSSLMGKMREVGDQARAELGHMSSSVKRPANALTSADVRQIRALELVLRQRGTGRARRWSVAALAAAAALLAVGLYLRAEHPVPAAQSHGVSASPSAAELSGRHSAARITVPPVVSGADSGIGSLPPDTRIEEGTELAWTSDATLNMPSGAHVELSGVGRLAMRQVDPKQEALRLEQGTVSVRVPKLPSGHAFEVRTPEATVVVVGTDFAVMRQATRTCVQVQEGAVSVQLPSAQSGKLLKAGDHWSSDGKRCTSARLAKAKGNPASRASAPSSSPAAEHRETQEDERSTLAEQNELLRRAVLLRKSGKRSESLVVLHEFERRFPNSPLLSLVAREKSKLKTGP